MDGFEAELVIDLAGPMTNKLSRMHAQDMTIEEPVVEATILTPVKCLGPITTCLKER